MPRKLRELRADLRRAGFVVNNQSGSHEHWRHEGAPSVRVTLAGKDGQDSKQYQEREVSKALSALSAERSGRET